jgi:deoxyribonuclease V
MFPIQDEIPGWDGSTAGARVLQEQLANQVRLRDGFPKPISTVSGFGVGREDVVMSAAVVLLDARDLTLIESHVALAPATMPCVPELLSFREIPVLLAAFRMLSAVPDMALVARHGIAHPQRFGVASHFGVATGIPTIGVAPTPLIGTASPLHQIRGAYTPLRDQGEQIGWLLRTQADAAPLVVSPGHKVAMASAADLVMRFVMRHRLPEPLRLAERLLSDSNAVDSPDAESE